VNGVGHGEAEGRDDSDQLAAVWNAAGIIVSAGMVRMAPAANARTNATLSGEEFWKRPAREASPDTMAIVIHIHRTRDLCQPAVSRPDVDEIAGARRTAASDVGRRRDNPRASTSRRVIPASIASSELRHSFTLGDAPGSPSREARRGVELTTPQQVPNDPSGQGESMSELASSETPVIDLMASMTADSLEATTLDAQSIALVRLAALVASGAPASSYALNLAMAGEVGLDVDDVRGVLTAIAPIVGTSRVAAATGRIVLALEIALEVAEAEMDAVDGGE